MCVCVRAPNTDGIRFSMGSSSNSAYNNHIVINGVDEKYTIFMYQGSDTPGVKGSDGRPRYNHVYGNSLISDYQTLKIMSSDENIFEVGPLSYTWYGNTICRTKPCLYNYVFLVHSSETVAIVQFIADPADLFSRRPISSHPPYAHSRATS